MGPEPRQMHKVEFGFFLLLIALFQLARITVSTEHQHQLFISTIVPMAISSSAMTVHLLRLIFEQYIQFMCLIEIKFINFIQWIQTGGFFIIIYYPFNCFKVFCLYQICSWQWWITYIFGIWNNPNERSIVSVFRDAGRKFEPKYKHFNGTYWQDFHYQL